MKRYYVSWHRKYHTSYKADDIVYAKNKKQVKKKINRKDGVVERIYTKYHNGRLYK